MQIYRNQVHQKLLPGGERVTGFQPLDEKLFEKSADKPDEAVVEDSFGPAQPPEGQLEAMNKEKASRQPKSSETTTLTSFREPNGPKPREWTVLFYLNGNCDLQDDMEKDLRSLEKVGSDDKIAFVAQISRRNKKGEAERVLVKKPGFLGLSNKSEVLEKLGTTNMAHPQSLKDFITWGIRKYPAEHYMLVLSGHGMGFVGSMPDEVSNDIMLTSELQSALNVAKEESGKTIDILGMDSCLMASAETAYAAKDAVRFMAASEEVVSTENWNYTEMASRMKQEANGDGLTVAEALESMVKSQHNNHLITSSIIDCRRMPEFAEKLKNFSTCLLNSDTPKNSIRQAFRRAQHYCHPSVMAMTGSSNVPTRPMDQMRDIVSVAMEIITSDNITDTTLKNAALDLAKFVKQDAVIFEMHRKKTGVDRSTGMSIYTPVEGAEKYADYYNTLSLAKDTGWGEVVKKFSTPF